MWLRQVGLTMLVTSIASYPRTAAAMKSIASSAESAASWVSGGGPWARMIGCISTSIGLDMVSLRSHTVVEAQLIPRRNENEREVAHTFRCFHKFARAGRYLTKAGSHVIL